MAPMPRAMRSSEYAVIIKFRADNATALKTNAVRHRADVSPHRGDSSCDAIFVSSANYIYADSCRHLKIRIQVMIECSGFLAIRNQRVTESHFPGFYECVWLTCERRHMGVSVTVSRIAQGNRPRADLASATRPMPRVRAARRRLNLNLRLWYSTDSFARSRIT